MPRILRIINRLNLGGPTFNVAYLTKYLAPEFETVLVAGMIDETEASSDFITHEMDLSPRYIPEMYREINFLKDSRAYLKIKNLIKEFRPDIVHTHAAKAGALGRMAASATNVPVILHTFHGHVFHSYFPAWKTRMFIEIERYLSKKSTRIITISQQLKKELGEIYKVAPPAKIEVIPLGLDLKKFSTDQTLKRQKFRSKYLIEEDEVVIIIVGRLVPIKNHSLFLRVLRNLINSSAKKIRAFIVGDGQERTNIENLASTLAIDFTDFRRMPVRATLTFTSWLKEIDEVYAGADIVAMTSLNEGTPVSLIEAQVAGKPIIATQVGGVTDIVTPNNTTFLVNSNDEFEFTLTLKDMIDNEIFKRLSFPNNASFLTEIYSHKRLARDMASLYRKLLDKR